MHTRERERKKERKRNERKQSLSSRGATEKLSLFYDDISFLEARFCVPSSVNYLFHRHSSNLGFLKFRVCRKKISFRSPKHFPLHEASPLHSRNFQKRRAVIRIVQKTQKAPCRTRPPVRLRRARASRLRRRRDLCHLKDNSHKNHHHPIVEASEE